MPSRVVAVIATYRRPQLLARLLASLGDQGASFGGAVVVLNGGDHASRAVVQGAAFPTRVLEPARNLGTGGGLGLGFQAALEDPAVTHVWVLDDDACATPGALEAMEQAGARVGAGAVSPLVPDATGVITWFPGPLDEPAWTLVRRGATVADFQRICGLEPRPWRWATWASLLIRREAIVSSGLPRSDFWYQSTDIEYTLRLSWSHLCVLAPAAVCPHLPPAETPERRRLKDRWSLQNNAFLSTRLRHGWRALRHLPGNHVRYWQRHGRDWPALRESWNALYRGACLGLPVGADAFYASSRSQR